MLPAKALSDRPFPACRARPKCWARMTPDEQRQALPLMFQQFTQMMQKIDPAVRRDLFQQWQQFRP